MSKRGQEHGSRTGKGLHSSWREAGGTGDLSACSQRMGAPEARQLPATVPWLLGSVRSAVGEELGLVWGGGVCTLRLFIQFEEHLLLPLLLVQIFLQSLFAWPKFIPPFLQVLVMALVQGLQLLGFMLYQEVTLFILEQIPGGRTGPPPGLWKTQRPVRCRRPAPTRPPHSVADDRATSVDYPGRAD